MTTPKPKTHRKVTRLRNHAAMFHSKGICPASSRARGLDPSGCVVSLIDVLPKAARPVQGGASVPGDFTITVEFVPRRDE